MTDIRIHCRFFARYAELLGTEGLELVVPQGASVSDALGTLRATVGAASRLPVRPLVAVNQAHVTARHVLADGDEMALLPPLAGG